MNNDKKQVRIFLPVMMELENMGFNPIDILFSSKKLIVEEIEACYVAITKTKEKYPEWYAVVSKAITGKLQEINNE